MRSSGIGIGAILSQHNQPVSYYSKALKGSALALSTYEKEMLAIVKSIRKWHLYLLGKPFTLRTDQKSLKYLLEQRITTIDGFQSYLVMIMRLSIKRDQKIKV